MIIDFKEKNCGGIYMIINSVNRKIYIGKTKNFLRRSKQYLYDYKQRRGDHINSHLMNAFDKYGFENFTMLPVEVLTCATKMTERELFWMVNLKTTERKYGYNLRMDSSSSMITHAETSIKISNNLKRQWANGDRSEHSNKLKASWCNNDSRRERQSKLLSKVKTKWSYFFTDMKSGLTEKRCYQDLKDMGISQRVLGKFSRLKTNVITIDGYSIERKPYEN